MLQAVGFGLLGVFVVTFLFQLNPWLSIVVCSVILMIVVEIVGLLQPMGVKLNALSITNVVIAVGLAVEFVAHYARAFIVASGTRNERMIIALHEMLQPMVNGALSTICALSVLALARYPFFRTYYSLMFVVIVLVSFANGLLLLPVVLSLVGPEGKKEVKKSSDYDQHEDTDGPPDEEAGKKAAEEKEMTNMDVAIKDLEAEGNIEVLY